MIWKSCWVILYFSKVCLMSHMHEPEPPSTPHNEGQNYFEFAIVWKNIDLIWHRLWKNVAMSCLTSPRPELSAKWILSILSDFTSHQLKSKHFGISLFGERIERIHFAESSSPRVNFYQCQINLTFVGFYQQKITKPPCQIG